MKALNPNLYATLTPRQRVIATLEAEARGDEQEVERLIKTCPKKTYTMNDAAYTDTMAGLASAILAVECDLLSTALICTLTVKRNFDIFDRYAQRLADVQAAWRETLEENGINPDTMAKVAPIRHPLLAYLLEKAPPPDPEAVKEQKKLTRNVFEGLGE